MIIPIITLKILEENMVKKCLIMNNQIQKI